MSAFLKTIHDLVALPAPAVTEFQIPGPAGGLAAALYQPHQPRGAAPLPVVLYFHGGGFVGGSIRDAEVPARFIAQHCPAVVLCVGYSLAPQRPFPAAPEDAYCALTWLIGNAARIGADAQRLAVAGDDAGGNLAACLAFIARDRNAGAIAAQVLIAPMLDPSMTRVDDAIKAGAGRTASECADCYRQYLPKAMQRMHPYAAPLESRRLVGLPAALLITADCDVLHRETEKYAAALIDAGVHTQFTRYAGIEHSLLRSHPDTLAEIVNFLRQRFAESPFAPIPKYSLKD